MFNNNEIKIELQELMYINDNESSNIVKSILNTHIDADDIESLLIAMKECDTDAIKELGWVLAAVNNEDSYKEIELIGIKLFDDVYHGLVFNKHVVILDSEEYNVLFYLNGKYEALDIIKMVTEENPNIRHINLDC